ncbi:HAD family hydrolase, partial [Acinetobacter baumannii]
HESFTQTILQFYAQGENIEAQPYAVEMFEYICSKNIKIALNTGFSRKITDAILHHLHWDNHPFISSVVASDEVAEGRPAPFMIQKIMQQLN